MQGNLSVVLVGAKRDERLIDSMAVMLVETLSSQYCNAERHYGPGRFINRSRTNDGSVHVLATSQVGYAEIEKWEPDVIAYINPGLAEASVFGGLSQTEMLQREEFFNRANYTTPVLSLPNGIDVMIADRTRSSIYQSEQGDVQQFVHSFLNRYRGLLSKM